MRYALTFGTFAASLAAVAYAVPWRGTQVWMLWMSVGFIGVSLAHGGAGPRVLGKRADGELPWWSWVVNGPFLLFGLASLRLVHLSSREHPWHEVYPGLLLGRRPSRRDGEAWRSLGVSSLLDCTAELPATRVRTGDEAYLSLPVLDSAAPRPDELGAAVQWIDVQRSRGPVYVHCALGRSRSATVLAAWLLAHGHADSVQQAEAALQRVRPVVWFTRAQAAALTRWHDRD